MTLPLARTGARVIAVERDERLAARLRRAGAPFPNVTGVTGDALRVPLPGRPFRVVANIPFSITTPLLPRLVASRMAVAGPTGGRGGAAPAPPHPVQRRAKSAIRPRTPLRNRGESSVDSSRASSTASVIATGWSTSSTHSSS